MTARLACFALAALAWFAAAGCGDKSPSGKSEGESPAPAVGDPDAVREIDLKTLPAVEPMPSPLDNGRILISYPVGWKFQPAGGLLLHMKDPMARFFPTLEIDAEEALGEPDVKAGNVLEVTKKIAAGVKDQKGIEGPVLPVHVGDFYGAYYEQKARQPVEGTSQSLRVLRLVTIRNGRRYVIDLKVSEGTQNDYKKTLLAVAGGLDFSPPAFPPPGEPGAPSSAVPMP